MADKPGTSALPPGLTLQRRRHRRLEPKDIDSDGRILMMRFRDDNGPWKKHASEPRLMVRRDRLKPAAKVLPHCQRGRIKAYDGIQSAGRAGQDRARPQPQFPRGMAAGERATRRGRLSDQ